MLKKRKGYTIVDYHIGINWSKYDTVIGDFEGFDGIFVQIRTALHEGFAIYDDEVVNVVKQYLQNRQDNSDFCVKIENQNNNVICSIVK